MTDDSLLPFSFPADARKKVTAAFDGGRINSNGGVMLLAMAVQCLDHAGLMVPEFGGPSAVIRAWIASGATLFGDEVSSIAPAWG